MEIMRTINLKEKVAIIGRVELFIMDNLNMAKEMDMGYGNQMAKNMISIKDTIRMIRNMEKVYIDGLMEQSMMDGLSKI